MGGEGSHIIKYIGFAVLLGFIYMVANQMYSIPFNESVLPSISNIGLVFLGLFVFYKGMGQLRKPTLDFELDQRIILALAGASAIYIGAISFASNFLQQEWVKQAFQFGQVWVFGLGFISLAFMIAYLGRLKRTGGK